MNRSRKAGGAPGLGFREGEELSTRDVMRDVECFLISLFFTPPPEEACVFLLVRSEAALRACADTFLFEGPGRAEAITCFARKTLWLPEKSLREDYGFLSPTVLVGSGFADFSRCSQHILCLLSTQHESWSFAKVPEKHAHTENRAVRRKLFSERTDDDSCRDLLWSRRLTML